MTEERGKFKLTIVENKVRNLGHYPAIGVERDNLVRVIVAVLDLAGFTKFFNKASPNQSIIVASYINAFLSWLNYRFDLERKEKRIPKPQLSKFLGDGVLYVWETKEGKTEQIALDLMNFCWNMTRGGDRYEIDFLPQFTSQLGNRWDCEYPRHLRASIAPGFAVKYTRRNHPPEYVAESINIATRLCGVHPELYFIAHSDLLLDKEIMTGTGKDWLTFRFYYVEKLIEKGIVKGIDKPIAVFMDKDNFHSLSDKTMFRDM